MKTTDILISKEELNFYNFRVLVEEMLKRRKNAIRKIARQNGVRCNWHSKKFKGFIREQIKEQGITNWLRNVNNSAWEAPRSAKSGVTLRMVGADMTPRYSALQYGINKEEFLKFVESGLIRKNHLLVERDVKEWKPMTFEEKMKIAVKVANECCQ